MTTSFRLAHAIAVLTILSALTTAAAQQRTEEAELHYNVALEALNDGNMVIALRELEAASRLTPANPLIHYNLAIVRQRMGKPAEALASVQQAISLGLSGDERQKANQMLARLTYEREKLEADLTWLREQHGLATILVCNVATYDKSTHFEGAGCDLTLVETITADGKNSFTRHPRVLSRIQSLRPTTMELRNCGGQRLATFFGADVTLAAELGQRQQKVTIWWQSDATVANRSFETLQSAARSCGAPLQ